MPLWKQIVCAKVTMYYASGEKEKQLISNLFKRLVEKA